MIKFTLKCEDDHTFESWFQSSDALDKVMSAGMVECIHCGSTKVSKSLMAPTVQPGRKKAAVPALTKPEGDTEKALATLRENVEKNSEYVGLNFAAEARAMHEGDTPQKSIYGEAKLEDAKSLLEDGVPVAPLPFMPKRNTN